MAQWIIFGASKGVGRHLVDLGLAAGHHISALVRSESTANELGELGVDIYLGDAVVDDSLHTLFSNASPNSIIFSTLGGGDADFTGNFNVIKRAEQHAIPRLLLVTSIGCGDTWPSLSPRAKSLFGRAVRYKSMAESYLQTSELAFTILRPGGLVNTAGSGHCELLVGEAHGIVSRYDVAKQLQKLAEDRQSYGQVYAVIDSQLRPNW
ncbi:SDR family oxidoreductase [Moellerella wisconsensis]|uniref:NAD(P)-binding oxidoreductase n=1 Tax=Moellerella wisconsensis TaxID=158849 RepID=UPI001F4EA4EE|nr:NAD(P)-binding oxidoreductase [Moellerella wisconsensis]UNH26186.1 SDR family oxidoreductase [Moellerella wisconsensis]